MKNLSREQIKIIYIALICTGFLFAFLFFVYLPQRERLSQINRKLSDTERQINEIESLVQGKSLAVVVIELEKKIGVATRMVPPEDNDIVQSLSASAKKLKIEVESIDPTDRQVLGGKISGFAVEELPVNIKMHCDFRQLCDFLALLRNDNSILTRIKQLSVKNGSSGPLKLDVNLVVSSYLAQGK